MAKRVRKMSEIERWTEALAADEAQLRKAESDLATIRAGGTVENLRPENAERIVEMIRACIANKRTLIEKLRSAPEPAGVSPFRVVSA